MAMDLILDGVEVHRWYAGLVAKIQTLLHKNWNVRVGHTLWEGNNCANWLAKEGAKKESEWVSLQL